MHDSRDFRVVPLLDPSMAAVIERAKPPTAMKNRRAGWQSEDWKADENKDCGQDSRTLGAAINEASINEVLMNDHRTPEAAQSQCFGNLNSPAGEGTLTEL